MNDKIYILKLTIEAGKSYESFHLKTIETKLLKETKTYFEFWDGARKRRLKKEQLCSLNHNYNLILNVHYGLISLLAYCFENQLDECKQMMMEKTKKEIEKRKNSVDRMQELFNSEMKEEFVTDASLG